MNVRINRRKYRVYAFDLESHNDSESLAKRETSMWLACLLDENSKIDDPNSYLYNMDDVLDKIESLATPKKRKKNESRECNNIAIYIYNLSFEWSFMLPVLEKKGFKWSEKVDKDSEFSFSSVSTKSCSSVWCVTLKFKKKDGIIKLIDLAKIYGGGLAKVAKAFNLPTQKGEIDYRKNRLHNYEVTDEEREYCFKDTRIIIDILIQCLPDKDFWNVISMASYTMKKYMKFAYPRKCKPLKAYREEYPELDEEETIFLRGGVGGGLTYAPRLWQFKDITTKILHIDAHQMHPSQVYKQAFPYGKGIYGVGEPKWEHFNHIYACHIRINYDDVKLHSIIQLIGLPFVTGKELIVWDFEIITMKKCYVNLEIEFIDYYAYNCKFLTGRKYVAENYLKRLECRKKGDQFGTLRYKLLNNSMYGKFLEKPHNEFFQNTTAMNGIIDSKVIEKSDDLKEVNSRYTYIPVGSCIPAYSRCCLVELALKFGWERIAYMDTDSLFIVMDDEEEVMKIWKKVNQKDFLGGWGLEEIIDRAQFTAPKRYKVQVGDEVTIKAGGINFSHYIQERAKELNIEEGAYSVSFDEINIVSSKWMIQRAFRCKGGTLIDLQEKEMSIQPKYIEIANKNLYNK